MPASRLAYVGLEAVVEVKIGCLAQLVNVIATIRTEPGGPSWQRSTFASPGSFACAGAG
jgi:alpha-L-arabinofuranosidase